MRSFIIGFALLFSGLTTVAATLGGYGKGWSINNVLKGPIGEPNELYQVMTNQYYDLKEPGCLWQELSKNSRIKAAGMLGYDISEIEVKLYDGYVEIGATLGDNFIKTWMKCELKRKSE